eukprot:2164650-Lingulodinium_polyedra.AAC.1
MKTSINTPINQPITQSIICQTINNILLQRPAEAWRTRRKLRNNLGCNARCSGAAMHVAPARSCGVQWVND